METKDGFLVINKDKGCTSHDCVKQIRKLLNTKKDLSNMKITTSEYLKKFIDKV